MKIFTFWNMLWLLLGIFILAETMKKRGCNPIAALNETTSAEPLVAMEFHTRNCEPRHDSVEYVVVHSTANDSSYANADFHSH